MQLEEIEDEKWRAVIERFRRYAAGSKSLVKLAEMMDLEYQTVKKILKGYKPNLLSQIKVEEWVKIQDEKRKR